MDGMGSFQGSKRQQKHTPTQKGSVDMRDSLFDVPRSNEHNKHICHNEGHDEIQALR